VADIGGCLSGLATGNDSVRVDEAESIDYDLSFDGLDGINDYCTDRVLSDSMTKTLSKYVCPRV